LPEGLDNLYADSLERVVQLGKKEWSTDYAPFVGVLSVAQESLTIEQLQVLTGLAERAVWDCVNELQQFIESMQSTRSRGDDDGNSDVVEVFHLYHHSFIDFLRRRQRILPNEKKVRNVYYLPAEEWHKQIVDMCEQGALATIGDDVQENLVEQEQRQYARRHYGTHLYQLRDWNRSCTVLGAGEYGGGKVEQYPVYLRRQAVRALGMLHEKRTLKPLIAAAKYDPDKGVRSEAPDAIRAIDPDREIEVLIEALKDEEEDVRWKAVHKLYTYGDSRGVEALIAALKDEKNLVREYAGYALGKYGDRRAVEQLIVNLQDEFGLAAMAAATALGDIGDSRAIGPLVERLPDKNQQYCGYVAEALEKFGERVTPVLLAALKDEGPDALYYSRDLLKQHHYRGSVDQLLKTAHMRYYAAVILGKVGDVRALPVLVWTAAKDKNETVFGMEKPTGYVYDFPTSSEGKFPYIM
jgi:HEAT repeat protein